MKLRNKQTGEIVENAYIRESHDFYNKRTIAVFIRNGNRPPERVSTGYETLAELNAEWEDAPEPKGYWYIRDDGSGVGFSPLGDSTVAHRRLIIGNYFESEEEAEKAVEKLKAWQRMKDTGCKPIGWRWKHDYPNDACYVEVVLKCQFDSGVHDRELDLLFGGEG